MTRRVRSAWTVAALLVTALDAYLLTCRWSNVGGNLEASVIWGTPALVAQHLALRRHVDRRHAELRDAIAPPTPTGGTVEQPPA